MAISYRDDHGADLMDFGIIDWFGSGGNSGGAGGALSAGAGAGSAIGSAAALLVAIGKEKWEKLFGGMDENDPLYIPLPEDVPSAPTIDPPKEEDIPSAPAIDVPKVEDIPSAPAIDVPKVEDVPNVNPEPVPPTILPGETNMEDNTFKNLENVITPFDPLKWAEDQQAKIWAREDAIRAETQAREDNAYQRAIEDMQRAGINPNLMGNINPAASGGGITNGTPADTALAQKQMEKDMELLKQAIENAFKGEENQKDRIWSLIEKVLGAGAMLGGAAIR